MLYRQDAMSEDIELEHIDHCVEYLRQVRLHQQRHITLIYQPGGELTD